MQRVKNTFDERKRSIDEFFILLKYAHDPFAKLEVSAPGLEPLLLSETVKSSLNSTVYLLLYNLVESTMTLSMNATFIALKRANGPYNSFSNDVRKKWASLVSMHLRKLEEQKFSNDFFCKIEEASGEVLLFDGLSEKFDGNLDAQKIRDICKAWGIRVPSKGDQLLTVKNNRNNLAHGDITFVDAGKGFL